MAVMEIALLVIGVIIFIISFLLPDNGEKKSEKEIVAQKEEVHRLVEQEIDGMKLRVNEATNETVEYAVGKAERSLEKVSNEKIMAVNEYAGTIMEEINKNHKEVLFLYDMLRDKQDDLTNVVRKADAKVKEIENASHSAQTASETLLRGMSVATVSQKGLTSEQKAVFDDITIPDAEPVIFHKKVEKENLNSQQVTPVAKQKGVALAQSKIFADLMNHDEAAANTISDADVNSNQNQASSTISEVRTTVIESQPVSQEKFAVDILSGSSYREGNVVGVDAPAGRAVTMADYAALINGATLNGSSISRDDAAGTYRQSSGPATQAPANNNEKIIELSKQGMSTVDIAKSLNLGVGEVKLVLDLFR